MKSSGVSSMTVVSLLLIALINQVGSFKFYPTPSTSSSVDADSASYSAQEEAFRREQIQQQQKFELLQQQQQQAEFQIQQQQLEAQRLAGRPFGLQQQQQQSYEFGTKGLAAPAQVPQYIESYPYDRQQYGPPRSTIAYLVVRPPYQMPMPYESAYQRNYQPMLRPYSAPSQEYAKPSAPEAPLAGTKSIRQEDSPPQPPPPPPSQPALVVPVHGDKHGKLRAMLDRLMSKLSISSYEVAGEQYVYPTPCSTCKAPVKQEAPIVQQPITQQQAIEQTSDEEPRHIAQQPIQQQQQQQTFIEQDKDQGFDEPPKSASLPQKPIESIKQEQTKLEEFPQQQQAQLPAQEPEQLEFNRQPQAPAKGGQFQQPAKQQPEAIQQQRAEEAPISKGAPKRYQQQQQQQYFAQQQTESIRQEPKGGF